MQKVDFLELSKTFLSGYLNNENISVKELYAESRLEIKWHLLVPNGYLHSGIVVSLADTISGYGYIFNLPVNAVSFTTIGMKSNFKETVPVYDWFIKAEEKLTHGGRSTQVWDVLVASEQTNKAIALFGCMQKLVYLKEI